MLNLPFFLIGFGAKQLFFCKKGLGGIYARGILTGIRTCDRGKKVPFKWKHFSAYVRIPVRIVAQYSEKSNRLVQAEALAAEAVRT